jgi:hypothetical protein
MNQNKQLEKAKHFVLIGPKGKQAGRQDQKNIALQFAAIKMTRDRFGGGIINLLLPKTKKQWETIEKLQSRGYSFEEVTTRSSIREQVRDAAINDRLYIALGCEFLIEKRNSQRAASAPVREFTAWITKKIKEQDPSIVRLFTSQPELLNRRKAGWWQVQTRPIRKRKK